MVKVHSDAEGYSRGCVEGVMAVDTHTDPMKKKKQLIRYAKTALGSNLSSFCLPSEAESTKTLVNNAAKSIYVLVFGLCFQS